MCDVLLIAPSLLIIVETITTDRHPNQWKRVIPVHEKDINQLLASLEHALILSIYIRLLARLYMKVCCSNSDPMVYKVFLSNTTILDINFFFFFFFFFFYIYSENKILQTNANKMKNKDTWTKHKRTTDNTEQHISTRTSARHKVISPEVRAY